VSEAEIKLFEGFDFLFPQKVRITDGALVAAAVQSDRYIADRFLPDKVWVTENCSFQVLKTIFDSPRSGHRSS